MEVTDQIHDAVRRAAEQRKLTIEQFIERFVPKQNDDKGKRELRRMLKPFLPNGYFDGETT